MRRGLAIAALLAAGVISVWLAGQQPHADLPGDAPTAPAVGVSGASIVLRHRGEKQAEVTADRVEIDAGKSVATLTGRPKVVFHIGGTPALTATAGKILFDRGSQAVRVEGGLKISTTRGATIEAGSGAWDPGSQAVDLAGGVTVTAPVDSASASLAAQSAPAPPSPSPSPTAAPAGQGSPGGLLGKLRADRIRYGVRDGVIVATGNVVFTLGDLQIRADGLRYDQAGQTAAAEGKVTAEQRDLRLTTPLLHYDLRAEVATASGGASLAQGDVTIAAQSLGLALREERVRASGGVVVTQGKTTLAAPTLDYSAKSGDAAAEGGIKVTQPGTTVTGKRLVANLHRRRAEVWEGATLVRDPPPAERPGERGEEGSREGQIRVTSHRMIFSWEVNEAEAEGSVVFRQRDRAAWADRMTYSEPSNRLVMSGKVILEQAADVRTRLTCSRLVMTLREGDITVEGPVTVTQKDRSAVGERGSYTEATKLLVLTGNVRITEADGRRLRADRVVISLADETFEAEGNVSTEFTVRTGPTGRP